MIHNFIDKIKCVITGSSRKNILTYLIFLAIATVFWVFTALNDEVQRTYTVPVKFQSVPPGVTLLNSAPIEINVAVKNKGRSLLRFDWTENQVINVNFRDFDNVENNRIVVNEQRLSGLVRNIFGNETEVIAVRPDSISLYYTTRPGEKLPVHVNIDARTAPQYTIYGNYRISTDSVTVYSIRGVPSSVVALSTQNVSLRDLTDSTSIEVPIEIPRGCRVEPPTVKVTIPVQPLVIKSRDITIRPVNVPRGTRMLTFPSVVKMSYLVPKNLYSEPVTPPTATVNYNDVADGRTTIPVTLGNIPDYYRGISASPDEVEYIIEHKNEQ